MSTTPPINGQLAKTVSQLGATGALIVISLALRTAAQHDRPQRGGVPPNEDGGNPGALEWSTDHSGRCLVRSQEGCIDVELYAEVQA